MSNHPPKPRFSLTVGVTGHRPNKLGSSSEAVIYDHIASLLESLKIIADSVASEVAELFSNQEIRISMISALAEGADRIAAQAALDHGYSLEVVLPFSREEYLLDFTESVSQQQFRTFLEKSDSILELPGQRDDPSRAYELSGHVMLDHVAVLIAIWDGKRADGRGGTYQIIEEAARRGVAVIVVDASGNEAPKLRWKELDNLPRLGTLFHDLKEVDAYLHLEIAARKILLGPMSNSETADDEAKRLCVYYRENRRKWHWRPEWNWLMTSAAVRASRLSDHIVISPEAATAKLPPSFNKTSDQLRRAFGWADSIASYYSQLFRSAFITNFLFAGLSVFIVAISLFFQKSLHLLEDYKWVFVLAEVVLITSVIVNTRFGRRTNWQQKWLESRELAERLRIDLAMEAVGIRPYINTGIVTVWTAWYERAILRGNGLPSLKLTVDDIKDARNGLCDLLEDQCSYHSVTAKRMAAMEKRLESFGEILFYCTIFVACGFLLGLWLSAALKGEFHIADELKYAVTAITAGLPALATAAYGIRVIADFEGNAHRSKRMKRELEKLVNAIKEDPPLDLAILHDRSRQAAAIMLGDVANWRVAAEGRSLAIPG